MYKLTNHVTDVCTKLGSIYVTKHATMSPSDFAKDLVIDYKYIRGTTSTSCVDFHCQSLNHHIMKTLYIFVTYKITMWQFWVFRTPENLFIYHWTCVPSVLKSTSFVPRFKQAYSLLECYFVVLTFAQNNSTRFLIAQCCFNSPNIRIDCKL